MVGRPTAAPNDKNSFQMKAEIFKIKLSFRNFPTLKLGSNLKRKKIKTNRNATKFKIVRKCAQI